jgi:hypothetical protein
MQEMAMGNTSFHRTLVLALVEHCTLMHKMVDCNLRVENMVLGQENKSYKMEMGQENKSYKMEMGLENKSYKMGMGLEQYTRSRMELEVIGKMSKMVLVPAIDSLNNWVSLVLGS